MASPDGSGIDFEVRRDGEGWLWNAYAEDMLVGIGRARTRIGLALALRRARAHRPSPAVLPQPSKDDQR